MGKRLKLGDAHYCRNCMVSCYGTQHRRCRGIQRQRGKRWWRRFEQ